MRPLHVCVILSNIGFPGYVGNLISVFKYWFLKIRKRAIMGQVTAHMPKFFTKESSQTEAEVKTQVSENPESILNPWAAEDVPTLPPHLITPNPVLDPSHEIEEHETDGRTDNNFKPFTKEELEDNPIRNLITWHAPARPFREKDKSYYTTIAIIITLLILIAFLAQEYLLIGALIAFTFVVYVLGFHPPQELEYRISTQGVTIGDHFYFWDELDSFWFSKKEEQDVLHILTHLRFPGQLILVLGDESEEGVKKTIARYLPYHEIAPKTLMDTWSNWLQRIFPLEKKPV
jgi:hypothetical protein